MDQIEQLQGKVLALEGVLSRLAVMLAAGGTIDRQLWNDYAIGHLAVSYRRYREETPEVAGVVEGALQALEVLELGSLEEAKLAFTVIQGGKDDDGA